MTRRQETAGEFLARLEADPEFVARRAERDAKIQKQEAQSRLAQEPLTAELTAAGFPVGSVWELVNTSEPYPEALPILVKHLQRPYPGPIREGIARALAVRPARFAWEVFNRLYRSETDQRPKDGLAAAIAATADDAVIDEVIELARDRKNGSSRVLLLSALKKSEDPRARAALEELQNDPDLEKEISVILSRRREGPSS